jgi:hypothetical protein
MLTNLAHLAFSKSLLERRQAYADTSIDQLLQLKKLGSGHFGEVNLVARRDS